MKKHFFSPLTMQYAIKRRIMKTSVRWKNNLQEMVLLISSKLESWILSRLPHLIYVNYTKNITMLRKHLFTPWINFGMMLKSNQNHHSELLSNCKSLKLLSPSSWKFSWKRQNQTEHNCRNSYLLNNIFNHMRLFFPLYRTGMVQTTIQWGKIESK